MKPTLFLENDMNPREVRLAKKGKKLGAKIVAVQNTLFAYDKDIEFYVDTVNANTKFPQWLPMELRKKLVWLRKWLGHIWYYKTLRVGKSSYLLRRGCSGMRDADIQTYLCEQQKEILLKNGVPEKKLRLLKLFSTKPKNPFRKVVAILIPSENTGGIDRTTKEFIPYEKQFWRWVNLYYKLKKIYTGYEFLLKFHPNTRNFEQIYPLFKKGDESVLCFKGKEYADYCIDEASVIIGFPPSFSTLLYQASVEYPTKEILSLDIGNEMFGDYFEGYDNIKVVKKI
jgi:hypothetical protein